MTQGVNQIAAKVVLFFDHLYEYWSIIDRPAMGDGDD